jgi:flagellar motor switch protein FliN/FliY
MTEEVVNKEESKIGVTMDKISRIPVDMTIEVGKAKLTLQEIIALKEGDVISLNKLSTDPFDIKVNGHKVAEGEIVQHENQFYVKVSHILDKAE